MRAKLAGAFVKSLLGAVAEHALQEGSAALRARLNDPDALARFREAVSQRLEERRAQQPHDEPPVHKAPSPEAERHAGRLSHAEALALLGLGEPFTDADVKRAHREAMLRNHPDKGGATYLTQLLNLARDTLLDSRGSPGVTPMPIYDLDAPLVKLADGQHYSLRQALMHTVFFGATGSGKTSSADLIRGAFLADSRAVPGGMGGVVLCYKKSECEEWEAAFARSGRPKEEFVIFGGPKARRDARLDPLAWEASLGDEGGGQVINTVRLLSDISLAAERALGGVDGGGGGGDAAYFQRTFQTYLTQLVSLVLVARERLTIARMRELAGAAAQTSSELKSAEFQSGPMGQLLAHLAAEFAEDCTSAERRADIDEVFRFWTDEWPKLNPRPKSIVETMFTTMITPFTHAGSPLRGLFTGGVSTVTPEDCERGKIIVVDLSVQEYKAVGHVAAQVWKHCFFRSVQRRAGAPGTVRPVFLWMDEFQQFCTAETADMAAVVRSNSVCIVALTQQIQSVSRILGEDTTENLLANLQTKFFLQNSGKTNEWASNLIGSRYLLVRSYGINGGASYGAAGGDPNAHGGHNVSMTEQLRPYIQPSEFLTLRSGGPANDFEVDTFVFCAGKSFPGEDGEQVPFTRLSFRQRRS